MFSKASATSERLFRGQVRILALIHDSVAHEFEWIKAIQVIFTSSYDFSSPNFFDAALKSGRQHQESRPFQVPTCMPALLNSSISLILNIQFSILTSAYNYDVVTSSSDLQIWRKPATFLIQ